MARRSLPKIDEKNLTKGQLRKLNALRKSVGPEIGDKAFTEWLVNQPQGEAGQFDKTAEMIAGVVWDLVNKENINLPRGGYLVRRGRGRIIVEPAREVFE